MALEPDIPGQSDDAGRCDPDDVALKSFFLGPQSENADWFEEVLRGVITSYVSWRRRKYPSDGAAISEADQRVPEFRRRRAELVTEVHRLMQRFEEEVPKFSPRYIGHMFSETSMPAMIGHVITLLHNPNNVSGESSRVGVRIEEEAIEALAEMLGFDAGQARGHFTSGGTVANFEAMIRARRRMERWLAAGAAAKESESSGLGLFEAAHMGWSRYDELRLKLDDDVDRFEPLASNPFEAAHRLASVFDVAYRGPVILVPAHKHYSWVKGAELLGLGKEAFWPVDLDERGGLCVDHLRQRIDEARADQRPVMMVVSVAGTTELGAFDPVDEVQNLLDDLRRRQNLHVYHHVDAAYGGFFAADVCGSNPGCALEGQVCRALAAIHRANSVTLDPHKLGYVPYSSGAFISARSREYFANSVDAPYIDFEAGTDRGPQTLEGSRSAAGAVATWLTARTIGLDADGYGRILQRTVEARTRIEEELLNSEAPVRIAPATSNILTFCVADDEEALSTVNARTEKLYEAFSPRQKSPFFVSRTTLRFAEYGAMLNPFVEDWEGDVDTDELKLLRLCVMNPFIDSRETDVDFPAAFARAVQRHCAAR